MKTQIKSFFAKQARTHTKHIIVFLGVNLLVGIITTGAVIHIFLINYYQTIEDKAFSRVNKAYASVEFKAERPQTELTVKEYVKQEVEKAGLKWDDINCIITKESNWDNWATNWNTNQTVDYGLFQINSIHKGTISVEDRYDYKKATEWAINKIKRDNSYCAWVSSKSCGLCK